jgi:hypothetical protein
VSTNSSSTSSRAAIHKAARIVPVMSTSPSARARANAFIAACTRANAAWSEALQPAASPRSVSARRASEMRAP